MNESATQCHSQQLPTMLYRILLSTALCYLCIVPAQINAQSLEPKAVIQSVDTAKLEFDAASVKQNAPSEPGVPVDQHSNVPLGPGNVYTPTGGLFSATNFPLLTYINFAYKVSDKQLQSIQAQVPEWARNERYTIQARTDKQDITKDQIRLMLRSLLADRFKLAVHYETRQVPIYGLTLAEPGATGPKLQLHSADVPCSTVPPASPASDAPAAPAPPSTVDRGFPAVCGGILFMSSNQRGRQKYGARNISMTLFVNSLTGLGRLDRPLVDQTGLTGNIDFVLEFTPEPPPGAAVPDSAGPTVQEAMRDQLGLKLVPQKGPIEDIVVDHIEHPSAN